METLIKVRSSWDHTDNELNQILIFPIGVYSE